MLHCVNVAQVRFLDSIDFKRRSEPTTTMNGSFSPLMDEVAFSGD
jgi:hypothetical protein